MYCFVLHIGIYLHVMMHIGQIAETHRSCVCFQHEKHDQTLYQIGCNVLHVESKHRICATLCYLSNIYPWLCTCIFKVIQFSAHTCIAKIYVCTITSCSLHEKLFDAQAFRAFTMVTFTSPTEFLWAQLAIFFLSQINPRVNDRFQYQ